MKPTPAGAVSPQGIAPPGFRLPSEARIGRVALQVGDLARSLAYYQTTIGLRVLDQSADTALLGTEQNPLVELHARGGVRPLSRHGRLGLYHFAILLPERSALGRFVDHLGRMGQRVAAADHAVSEAIYLWDPDGLGIEVYADRPASIWHHEGREIRMVSEALDLRDLMKAGEDAPWGGVPGGASMGHVHLHVGDLERARGFYHNALGFDITAWTYPGALFLAAGGYHHHIGTNVWAAHAPSAGPDDARLLEWRLELPTREFRDRLADNLERSGFAAERGHNAVLSRDPWGTQVRIVAPSE